MLLEKLHHHLGRLLELRVLTLPVLRRIKIDFVIGSDAMVFHFPFAIEAIERGARSGNPATIDEFGIAADADESAPGLLADQRTQPGFTKVPRQRVAARA